MGGSVNIPMVLEPLAGLALLTVVALLMRWTWSRGHSYVTGPGRSGNPNEYGLLVEVAAPASAAEGEDDRNRLAEVGIRATVTMTSAGARVMVFPEDRERAASILHYSR